MLELAFGCVVPRWPGRREPRWSRHRASGASTELEEEHVEAERARSGIGSCRTHQLYLFSDNARHANHIRIPDHLQSYGITLTAAWRSRLPLLQTVGPIRPALAALCEGVEYRLNEY
jgi:hypothetical protein